GGGADQAGEMGHADFVVGLAAEGGQDLVVGVGNAGVLAQLPVPRGGQQHEPLHEVDPRVAFGAGQPAWLVGRGAGGGGGLGVGHLFILPSLCRCGGGGGGWSSNWVRSVWPCRWRTRRWRW